MRGLWIEDGSVRLRDDLPAPDVTDGETIVEVTRAGVCGTDLGLREGYMGFTGIPGHEFVGVALDGPHAGARVVGEINAACGACSVCKAGRHRHCPTRTVLGIQGRGGAMAEQLRLPTENLHLLPASVSDDAATFVEPLAAALHILEDVAAEGARVLVVGDGRLGILCAWAMAMGGATDLVVAGRHLERAPLLPDDTTFAGELGVMPSGEGSRTDADALRLGSFDVVVEASGRGELFEHALRMVRPKGTFVMKTTSVDMSVFNATEVVVNELRIVGSRCGPFGPAIEALARGAVPVERFVSARYSLGEGTKAFEAAARRDTLKVLVDVVDVH